MGKLAMFGISFDNDQGVYYAGQIVKGCVTIELRETMKMRGVHVKVEGSARVSWDETRSTGTGKDSTTETVSYTATEKYVDQDILLAGRRKSDSGEDIHLPAGRHTYPFSFQLPPQLPSSFEGQHGHVRYTFKGTIDKPWKFDHTTKRPFTVICLLDLNREPTAAQSVEETRSKQFCCLWCKSGPINAMLVLDRRGFIPGETIHIRADIENNSNRHIKETEVILTMETVFHAQSNKNTSRKRIAVLKHGSIREGGSDTWNGDALILPPTPPSYLRGCNIINIKYTLELRVVPSGPGYNLVVPVEVIIGTIPLQRGVNQPGSTASLTNNIGEYGENDPPPPYSPPIFDKSAKH